MMDAMKKYENRYGDVFTFEQLENGNIQWKGDFKYCRVGVANDYSKAWKKFKEDYGGLNYDDFIAAVHTYDEEKGEYLFPDLTPLITSNVDVINMVDPSGGPFITEGTNMKTFGLKGKVKEFKSNEDGYEIVIK